MDNLLGNMAPIRRQNFKDAWRSWIVAPKYILSIYLGPITNERLHPQMRNTHKRFAGHSHDEYFSMTYDWYMTERRHEKWGKWDKITSFLLVYFV